MSNRVIIFDFDGTIADSYAVLITITNRLAEEFGYQPITKEEILLLEELTPRDIIKRLNISIWQIHFFLTRVSQEFKQEINNIQPIAGMVNCLQQLQQQGYLLGIITSNTPDNVGLFLERNSLTSLFEFIYSGTSIFGKHKVINNFLKEKKFTTNQIIYVGDETRDIKAAKKSKIKIISVTWGFNSTRVLAKYQPDFIVDCPEKLLETIISCQ